MLSRVQHKNLVKVPLLFFDRIFRFLLLKSLVRDNTKRFDLKFW